PRSLLARPIILLPPPRSPLFPYTTLFRSARGPKAPTEGPGGVLTAVVGVTDGLPLRRPPTPDRHLQGVDDELGADVIGDRPPDRSEEHTSELQSRSDLVCRLLLEKKKKKN